MQKARLLTRPVRRLVEPAVLPGYEWCAPRWLDVAWPDGGLDQSDPITADNPARMVFVIESDRVALPSEPGAWHLPGLPASSRVLAPWAIDDATDAFFEAGIAPEEALSLATDSLRGVFWGLHDWAHFHSHGPFERIAETELQCDVAALRWLDDNAERLGVRDLEAIARDVAQLWQTRFEAEDRTFDLSAALSYATSARRSATPPVARG